MSQTVHNTEAQRPPREHVGNTIFKNTFFATLGTFGIKAVNFLFSVLVVRQLGDNRFGQYAIIIGFVGILQMFAELGITQYAMREIARDRSKVRDYFWNLICVRLLLATLSIGGITLAAKLYGYEPDRVLGIFIYTVSFLLAAFQAPLESVLTGNERLAYVAASSTIGQLFFVIAGSAFLLNGLGYVWLIVASLLSIIPKIIISAWGVRRHHLIAFGFAIQPRTWLTLIRNGLPFGMITLTLTIATSIDTVMMSRTQPDNVVGWYNVAYNLVLSLAFLSSGFKEAIVPSLSRTFTKDPLTVEKWYQRSAKIMLLLTIPIAAGGTVLARPIIETLYKQEFLPSALVLQVMIWDLPLIMYAGFCGRITTVISAERTAARIYIINAAANVIMNLYAIPRYGMMGAAYVTVLTDLISALQFYFILRSRNFHLPLGIALVLRVLLAAAVMVGCVWGLVNWLGFLPPMLNLLITIPVGALVYLLLVLRAIHKEERDTFEWLTQKFKAAQNAAAVFMLKK